MIEIILASTSPARQELLRETGLNFRVEGSSFDETIFSSQNPEELVQYLALGKARVVAQRNPAAVVIGADTIIFHNNKIIGKPTDKTDVTQLLKSYGGLPHAVYTGLAVVQATKEKSCVVKAEVIFRNLSDKEIADYIQTGEPFGNAGSYTIQKRGATLIDSIHGDYYAIIGLPIFKLFKMLREFGVNPLE